MGKSFGEFKKGNKYTYCFKETRDRMAEKAIREGWEVEYCTSFTGKPSFKIVGRKPKINILKDVCPVCLTNKIELGLSNVDYIEKYPADYVLTLGVKKIYLCEHHIKQLAEMFIEEWSDKV